MSRAAKGADCKSAGYAFAGSSPASPTTLRPDGASRGAATWSTIVLGEAVPVIALRSSQSEAGRRRAGAANFSSSEHAMWYVYIIRSINSPDQEYTGATRDLKQRLSDHNSGKSTHTSKFAPWELRWYCVFPDKYKALDFEKYLKSASGRAFAKKRL